MCFKLICLSVTFVEVLGELTGVATAIGAALLDGRALSVLLAALHTGGSKPTGLLWGWTVALLHTLHRLQKLAARQTLVVLLGKKGLCNKKGNKQRENRCHLLKCIFLATNRPLFELTVLFTLQPWLTAAAGTLDCFNSPCSVEKVTLNSDLRKAHTSHKSWHWFSFRSHDSLQGSRHCKKKIALIFYNHEQQMNN